MTNIFSLISLITVLHSAQVFGSEFTSHLNELETFKFEWEGDSKFDKFCGELLSGLKKGGAHIRPPVIQSKIISDNRVKKIIGQCNASDLVTSFSHEPGVHESVKDFPKSKKGKFGTKFVRKGPFKIYRANVYGTGKESLVIYGSCNQKINSENDCKGHFTYYSVIDIENCAIESQRQVYDEIYSKNVDTGIISFRNVDYFFDGKYEENEEKYYVTIHYWNYIQKRKKGFFQKMCSFATKL